MSRLTLNAWGKEHPITFRLDHYADNNNLYVGMVTHEDGYAEPWSDLTVNLDIKCAEDCAFIDTNNNGEKILLWLIQNKLGDTDVYINDELCECAYPMDKENHDDDLNKRAILALADKMGYEAIFLFEEMAQRLDEMLDEIEEDF